ncbi:MAG: endonuclease/exonuclease/phosphatase family protein [Methylomonas sp.]|nr:endonuclease/exonuclease/phosphatase family protein [Methylomonas sp.]
MSTSANQKTFSILTFNTKLFKGSLMDQVLVDLEARLDDIKVGNLPSLKEIFNIKVPHLSEQDDARAIEIVKKIKSLSPDIVCLQEVWGPDFRKESIIDPLTIEYPYQYMQDFDFGLHASDDMAEVVLNHFGDIPSMLRDRLKDAIKLVTNSITGKMTNGLVILSKTKLSNCSTTEYARLSGEDPEDTLVRKGFAKIQISAPVNLTLATTHMPTTPDIIYQLLSAKDTTSPARWLLDTSTQWTDSIFLGDFNLHYYTDSERKKLNDIMRDINPNAEDLLTRIKEREAAYTDLNGSKERIDYIYFSQAKNANARRLSPRKVEVLDWHLDKDPSCTLSDHRPVLATFDIVKG